MSDFSFENSKAFAEKLDQEDSLRDFRSQFHIPKMSSGNEMIYLAGNSLGLQPKIAKEYIDQELTDWAQLGVEGHFRAKKPWLPYHENVTEMTARLVGAMSSEVVVMNTLTVNLHLMLVSFFRPSTTKFKIIMEGSSFPSDRYAVVSQLRFHGIDPQEGLIEILPREGEYVLRKEDILAAIEKEKESLALVLFGSVNYLTGQAFDIRAITEAAHRVGAFAGFDFAHGAGNLILELHDWNVDFAVWCTYKYLNAGPGGLGGCFVHERHGQEDGIPRFAGWWGHDKNTRFQMGPEFRAIPGAEGWQLSNPPIFQLAALRASLEIFDRATMPALRAKAERLTGFLEFLLKTNASDKFSIVTPQDPRSRGNQLSLRIKGILKEGLQTMGEAGVVCDFREPDIVRVAPTPLYNTFSDVHAFVEILGQNGS